MQNLKKIFLSSAVILVSALYVAYESFAQGGNTITIPSPLQPGGTAISPSGGTPSPRSGQYADGTYTGNAADSYYGAVQVRAIVQNGALANVEFLKYPNDRETSIFISQQATPILKTEAIKAQSAQVDIVSGATDTSIAFQESLGNALAQAKR